MKTATVLTVERMVSHQLLTSSPEAFHTSWYFCLSSIDASPDAGVYDQVTVDAASADVDAMFYNVLTDRIHRT
jgi:hypothetical protein